MVENPKLKEKPEEEDGKVLMERDLLWVRLRMSKWCCEGESDD